MTDRTSVFSSNGKSKEHLPIKEVGGLLSESTVFENMMRRLQLPTYGVFQKIVTMSSPVLATSSVSDDLTNRSKLSGYLGQKRRFASEKDICCFSSGNLISGEEKAGQNAFMRSLDERITVEIHCSMLVWRPFLGELHVPLAGRFEDYCGATLFGELFGDFFHASFDFLVLDSKLIEVIYALATLKMNQAKLEKFSRKDSKFRSVDQESSDLPSTQQHGTVSDHDTAFLSRSEKKMAHNKMVYKLIEKYSVLLVCSADNVGSNQLQAIRQRLRPDSVVFLGKNAMMKKSIQTYAEKSGNIVYQNMIPLLVGNVCLIFTKGDLIDVVVPPGNTVLELMKKGDKASSSESDLLSKLGIRPFSHGLVVKAMYGNGSVFDPAVLDLVEDELKENFSASFSLWQPFLCLSTVLH